MVREEEGEGEAYYLFNIATLRTSRLVRHARLLLFPLISAVEFADCVAYVCADGIRAKRFSRFRMKSGERGPRETNAHGGKIQRHR